MRHLVHILWLGLVLSPSVWLGLVLVPSVWLGLVLVPSATLAEELRFGGIFETRYDSDVNVAGSDGDDVIFGFGPELTVTGEYRRFEYQASHSSVFEKYDKQGGLDGWRHRTALQTSFMLSPRWVLNVSDSLSVLPTTSAIEEDLTQDVTLEVEPVVNRDNELLVNTFNVTLQGALSPRWTSLFQVGHYLRDFDQPTAGQQDSESFSTVAQTLYQLNGEHQVGLGGRFVRRTFEASRNDFDNETDIYEVFGIWSWEIDPRTLFRAQIGPAFAEDDPRDVDFLAVATLPGDPTRFVDPSTCNQRGLFPGFTGPGTSVAVLDASCAAFDQAALTEEQQSALEGFPLNLSEALGVDEPEAASTVNPYFSFSLTRTLERGNVFVEWRRSDSQNLSFGSVTTLDTFRTGITYRPRERWVTSALFNFTRRSSDFDQDVVVPLIGEPAGTFLDGPFAGLQGAFIVGGIAQNSKSVLEDDVFNLQFRLAREFGRASLAFAQLNLRRQESRADFELNDVDLGSSRSTRNQWQFRIGVYYRFRPIRL
jgi:hypothetical protein